VKWLTRGGAAAALAVGLATLYGFGWRGMALLLAFFISGSVLTAGGGQRRARQVVANGGVAALAALAGSWPAFAGAIAAATADTWATEVGRFSRHPPRLISTWRPVPAGTDGGITLLGTVGGMVGAAFIAGLSVAVGRPVAVLAGIVGMLFDSLLGATIQGSARWLDNDAVNVAATLAGAAVALAW
jgi:uncharacterized protein (TIGR00297 family)